jgi:hypothetical protein
MLSSTSHESLPIGVLRIPGPLRDTMLFVTAVALAIDVVTLATDLSRGADRLDTTGVQALGLTKLCLVFLALLVLAWSTRSVSFGIYAALVGAIIWEELYAPLNQLESWLLRNWTVDGWTRELNGAVIDTYTPVLIALMFILVALLLAPIRVRHSLWVLSAFFALSWVFGGAIDFWNDLYRWNDISRTQVITFVEEFGESAALSLALGYLAALLVAIRVRQPT